MKIPDKSVFEQQNVFGIGAENTAYARYFIGNSYLNPLTKPEDGLFLANVTFEPGCRNIRRRPNAYLYRRRRLVSGSRQTGGQSDAGNGDCNSGKREALAWGQSR